MSDPRKSDFWIKLAPLAPLLLLGISIALLLPKNHQEAGRGVGRQAPAHTTRNETDASAAASEPQAPLHSASEKLANPRFRDWFAAFTGLPTGSPERGKQIHEGLLLAKARKPLMERLIREDPRRALAAALRFDEWAVLPDEIKAEVERPFSAEGAYTYYPICREPGTPLQPGEPTFTASLTMPDGSNLQAFPYGRRDGVFSKRSLPVQGISLNGLAAMRDGPLQIVAPAELATLRKSFPDGQADMSRSIASGTEVGENATYAISGGRIYVFADRAEAEKLDTQLAELDAKPGPFAASALLADSAYAAANGSLNLPQVQTTAVAQSSAWTETKKKLFLIRVNFTDKPEEPVTKAAAEAAMAESSERIREMSYGKTWVENAASANVYTMPKTFEYYNADESKLFHELLSDARNTFRQTKYGLDASVNLGAVSYPLEGQWSNLGDYDIVGIFRTPKPGEGGVAGGDRLWMMSNTVRVYTHEWGHNYGVHHAALWKTTDGSVAGAGVNDEYGDPFDVMGHGPTPEAHLHPEAKSRLNWLPASRWKDVQPADSGLYRVYRIDDPDAPQTLNALRIPRGGNSSANGYYWVGHRGAFTANPHLKNGAYLIWQRPAPDAYRSWLLDTTPDSVGGTQDSALSMGRTFSDPQSHAFLTTVGAGGSGSQSYIDVRVNLGPFPNNAAPQASEMAGPATVQARAAAATYSVTGADANGDPLAYAWNTSESIYSPTPNAPSLQCQWIVGGNYPLSVTVSDMKGGTITQTKNVRVEDSLDYWTAGNVGRAVTMTEAHFGNGVVMGLGYWGELFRSWDGVNWAEVKHNTGLLHWTRLAFGNGRFVMSGHRDGETVARIACSDDGRIWSMAQVTDGAPIMKTVAFGGGKFVAAGDAGSMLWSTDGIIWNSNTVPGFPDFRQLAWNGSTWMALARNPANNWIEMVWSSTDGVFWTQRGNIGVDGTRIIGHNGVFYFMTWWAGIKRSIDNGLSWKSAVLPSETRWSTTQAGIANDGTMVAIGIAHDEAGAPQVPLVSVDGITWHRATSEGSKAAVTGANNLCFGAGRLITLSNDGVVKYSEPLVPGNSPPVLSASSIGGTTDARGVTTLTARASDPEGKPLRYFWDFGPIHPIVEGASADIVLPFGGSYQVTLRVIDANGGLTTSSQTISIADPAISFTTRTSGVTNYLGAIAANDTIAVAVGDANHPILTSTNGSTWTKRTLPEWTYVNDIVWDGGKFIVMGHGWRNSVWNNVIYTSPDGISWTLRFTAVGGTQLVRSLAAGPGAGAVAVGDNGLCLRSADGITWSTLVIPALGTLGATDVAWGPSGYVMTAVSYSPTTVNKVFTSPDGITWTDRSAGTGLDAEWKTLLRTAWLNDRFVSAGWYSGIRSSFDGGSTFAQARTAGNIELRAMAYGNGVYFGAGWDRDNSGVDVDVFSLNGDDWYSFSPGTTNDRLGAVFFKDTFITVGETGEIRQSGPMVRPQEVFAFRRAGPVVWDSVQSEARHAFLALPGQTRVMEYSTELTGPWQTLPPIETGPLGLFEATFRQTGDLHTTWGKRMFFRLRK